MAVYTDVGDADLDAFLSAYELGTLLSFKGIAEGVENSNFLLRTESGSYILTLYEKRVAEADLPYFLGLMEHLSSRGIRCPLPVRGKDGETLRKVAGRPAALVTFLDGMWVRRPQTHHCAALGQALAEMQEGSEKKLTIVPGASHLFEEPGTLEHAARLAMEWFQTHLVCEVGVC